MEGYHEGGFLTTVYKVRDTAGHVVALHERKDYPDGEKRVFWKQPDGTSGLNGTKLPELPLYGSEAVKEWDPDDLIILVEGEKARDALAAAGLKALGTVTGAGATPSEKALEVLRDRRVVGWSDNDTQGRKHMEKIAERLHGIVAEVSLYEWDDAPQHGDAADHPAVQSRNPEAVDRLLTDLEGAPRWEPEPPESARDQSRGLHPGFNLTDLGNAERLVHQHGHDLMFCYKWNKWLVWDGRRWAVDNGAAVELRAKKVVRSIYAEASEAEDDAKRKAISDHAKRSEARDRINAMIVLARSEPGIPVQPEELDADPLLLNTPNGSFDFRAGRFRPHDRFDLITKIAGTGYDPNAEAPTWKAFLERVLPSPALRRFVKRLCGYALTGDVSEQTLPLLCGPGANGKSTLINAVLEMLGDYGQQAAPDLLLAKRGSHPTELADLFGARLVASVEVEDGRRFAESLVKQLTGGDRIKARRMREDFWEFNPTHKVLLAANHKPEVRGTDHAIWRRIKLVPFDVTIPKSEQDPRLPEKLRAELPGILAWAVKGCLEWRREGLGEPDEVRVATEGYRGEMDVLAGWINERCVVREGAWATFADLYADYKEWCAASGETSETKTKLGSRLTERGFDNARGAKNVAIRRGIALRYDGAPDPSRVNGSEGDTAPEATETGVRDAETINRVNGGDETVNSQNTCKTEGVGEWVNSCERENGINGDLSPYKGLYPKPVNNHPPVNPDVVFEGEDDFADDPGETEPDGAAAGRDSRGPGGASLGEPEEPDEKTLSRVRWAFKQRGQGPALNLPHYRSGDCSLEVLVGSVLYELREDHRRMAREELQQWASAVKVVAMELRGQSRPSGKERNEPGHG